MATDAVPFDLLRSSLDSLKLRFQAANDPGSPSKAWLVHVHDRGDEKAAIFARADGYNAASVNSSPSTWSHVGVAAIVRRVPRFKRCTQLKGHQRLGPICEDAARLLDTLPTAVQHQLWHGLPDGTQLSGDGLSRWLLAVFEIGNANVAGSSLRCDRVYPITGDQAKAIFAPESGLPADADWYAMLSDFTAASVEAIDILQSWLGDVPKQVPEAAADGDATEYDARLTPAENKVADTGLSDAVAAVRGAYEWAISKIEGADEKTISELFDAIQSHSEMTSEYLERLPDNAETFGKYLRRAGIRRYKTSGSRARRPSRHPRT